jgi:DNA-binding PadR family transcriptional regulator
MRLSRFQQCVLDVVRTNEPISGLPLLDMCEQQLWWRWWHSIGSILVALHVLEKRGLLVSWWGSEDVSERDGARRRYYAAKG